MTVILVEIVRMTLDAFWSEKSTICKRNISPLTPRVANTAAIGRPKMAYLDVEKNHKNKRSQRIWFIFVLFDR